MSSGERSRRRKSRTEPSLLTDMTHTSVKDRRLPGLSRVSRGIDEGSSN